MACKGARKTVVKSTTVAVESIEPQIEESATENKIQKMLFGVDSKVNADDLLQNNIDEFEWVIRNKIYPNFWGRNIVGENALTKKEIEFIHSKGCKIAAIYEDAGEKLSEEQGKNIANKVDTVALELGIPAGSAIFLKIDANETITRDFLLGYAESLIKEGFWPAFMANTDAAYTFDREYSRGMQTHKEIFKQCLIWAVSPSLKDYDRVTTTHLIHPDNWVPFAPSGITRQDIAVWQYGKNCHPINDDAGKETTFNVNLVINPAIIIEAMF
ncbi:MAG: DUF1906 domain-containing protein [Ruminococcaceae bacterium]|nr:DUF1906 domain-containing protein [Oscillospiraceae bacterium]